MTKSIPLTRGKFAIVDDEDFEELSKHKWYCSIAGYAIRSIYVGRKQQTKIWMHREIIHTPPDMQTDHINGNRLDNRRGNLRICTSCGNSKNRKLNKNNISGFKGVAWDKKHKRWWVHIKTNGNQKHLGYFDDTVQAAHAYDEAAKKYHGEFARLNFPEVI